MAIYEDEEASYFGQAREDHIDKMLLNLDF